MSNPWDAFPFPAMADDEPKHTYYGVGLVMSGWESIEFEFARLYSIFIGDEPDGMSMRDYGTGRIFSVRIDVLNQKAEAYFVNHPCQKMEGEFSRIVIAATGFSARRNDVAHGIVMNVAGIRFFQNRISMLDPSTIQTVLVPPFHILRSHDGVGMPSYAYNKNQLEQLALRLHELELAIREFRVALVSGVSTTPQQPSRAM